MSVDSPSVARHPRVVHSELAGGEALLLHLDTGAYHELNAVGAAIWARLDGRRDAAEVAADLREALADPPDDLDDVVVGFLSELRRRGLVT